MTDEELVLHARTDKSACEVLVLRFMKLIFIRSEFFVSPDIDRDDLRQEGLMGLLNAVAGYDTGRGAKFSTFAEVCINNRMRSFCTKTRKVCSPCDELDEIAEENLSVPETPETILISKEFFSELRYAVENILSETERQVFELVIRGVSYKETAEKLGISEKSADNAVQRARRKIRAYLK